MDRKAREDDWSLWMRAAIGGDEAAYKRLLADLSRALRGVVQRGLYGAGAARDDVEDIVQETLLAIHLKRHTWDRTKPLGPWVVAIARNKLIDALRRRGRRAEVPVDDLLDTLESTGTGDAANALDIARVLSHLNGRNRDIVRSIAIDGHTARDVASRLGMTEVAVRVSLHRSLKALAETFSETKLSETKP